MANIGYMLGECVFYKRLSHTYASTNANGGKREYLNDNNASM